MNAKTDAPSRRGLDFLRPVVRWFDSWSGIDAPVPTGEPKTDWVRVIPFLSLHLACGLVWIAGVSAFAIWFAVALYFVRIFAITGFYHRYFSHRTFKTSRAAQFVFAVLGNSAAQRGPLWWAAHHRDHHQSADTAHDPHSPRRRGFWWSHVGWITAEANFPVKLKLVPDLLAFPELRFLDRFDALVPAACAGLSWILGDVLRRAAPELGVDGFQLVVWFVISTVFLFHATFTINSLAHLFGSRRYAVDDDSRNNFWLALLTFGEGWHNNHHRFPGTVRQGFRAREIDVTWYVLWLLSKIGLIRDLKPIPAAAFASDGDAS